MTLKVEQRTSPETGPQNRKNKKESERNMKTILATSLLVTAAVLAAFFLGKVARQRENPVEMTRPTVVVETPAIDPTPEPRSNAAPPAAAQIRSEASAPDKITGPAPETNLTRPALPPLVSQSLQTLTSSQASFGQKQTAWQQLRNSGKLDQAISELEQGAASQPNLAEYPATLGQAYLHKAGSIQDVREQGILGMKADQSFDAALALDPASWDARFWKATAMSYWPAQLGKGAEVVEHCLELVRLQESQPSQPQYYQTYLLLGEQYQRMGHTDYARQSWQRGLTLFPDNAQLQARLNGNQGQPQTASNQ
jgi:tetratricopeptide (TPR) repeat protein